MRGQRAVVDGHHLDLDLAPAAGDEREGQAVADLDAVVPRPVSGDGHRARAETVEEAVPHVELDDAGQGGGIGGDGEFRALVLAGSTAGAGVGRWRRCPMPTGPARTPAARATSGTAPRAAATSGLRPWNPLATTT